MKRFLTILLLSLLPAGLFAQALPAYQRAISKNAKGYAQRYIELVDQSEPLRSASWGVFAVKLSGDTLAMLAPERKLIPASNMKLITTGAAMHFLGPDFRWKTKLAYSGTIQDGVLQGDLYLVGGGDPTIGSRDTIAPATETLFSRWAALLAKAGIRKIDGRLIGDGRYFDGPLEMDEWSYQDVGTYYGTGGNGLCFYRNVQDIDVAAGDRVGDPVKVTVRYPETPWVRLTNRAKTGKTKTGDKLYLFCTDFAPAAEMRGTFAIDRKPKKEECSNKFGAATCANEFKKYLEGKGITITKGIADLDAEGMIRPLPEGGGTTDKAPEADALTLLGTTESPTLAQVAYLTNHRSDNFYAETLLRTLSRKRSGTAVYDSCRTALTDVLKNLKINMSYGAQIVDGSGLGRQNYIAPEFFCRFLKAMMDSPVFPDYIQTLGQPGLDSYADRMSGESPALKDRIYYKSGSMNGVRCFSGYIVPSDGSKEDTIVFSVMTNNCTAPSWKVYPMIDRIIALLAAEN